MDKFRPGALATIGGGAVLLVSSFLTWWSFGSGIFVDLSFNAYNSSLFGLTGVFLLIIAIACIAVPLLGALAPDVKLPDAVVGFTLNQVLQALGFAVLLLSFSLLFRTGGAQIGTILALISSLAIVGGTHMEHNATS